MTPIESLIKMQNEKNYKPIRKKHTDKKNHNTNASQQIHTKIANGIKNWNKT